MEREWTDMQLKAIEKRDKTLLVSAAAGSGKTATLTERIITSMLDKKDPIGIDEMLMVTYTRKAAGELREKISRALKKAVASRPDDEKLARQLYLLPSAKISTIDSFCSTILRANADRVGVNPDFKLADGAESEMLAESILDGLIGSIYEGNEPDVATPEALERLSECMTDTRSEGELALVILSLYKSTLSSIDGVGAITKLISEYDPSKFTRVENTFLGKTAITFLHEAADHHAAALSSVLKELISMNNPKVDKLINLIENDIVMLKSLGREESYVGIRTILNSYDFPDTPSISNIALPPSTPLRAAMKSDILARKTSVFDFTEDDWRTAYGELFKILYCLASILERFDKLFLEEKKRRGMLEYSDVERLTYECLWQNGELTEVALSERRLYRAIYIDEYQDVNNLQNKIFEAISTETNRFMVGDIKQSIYAFRSANSDIFTEMKTSFPPIDESDGSDCATIFMSNNFRCDRGIVDFVNDIFDRIFYHMRSSIGYQSDDKLKFSKPNENGEPPYRYPEICITSPDCFGDAGESMTDRDAVAMTVAEKIKELKSSGVLDNGDPIGYGDIAIIMRNARGREGAYKAALDSLGIPCAVADDAKFFMNSEVLLALCLLNSIDNPRRDIYLTGLLSSPLYSFTPSELASIKSAGGDTLYDSLVSYTDTHSFEKGKRFLEDLRRYRTLSEGMPTDELISMLFAETGLLVIATERGSRDNLMLLFEHARRFESGSYRGLYNFLTFINGVINRKNAFDKREAPSAPDAVKIITAHSSKGLEYPIVFFVEVEASFEPKRYGPEPRYIYKEDFGIGLYARTPSGLGLVENPTKAIIKEYSKRRAREEEARILYVALTRAIERLYVVICPTKAEDKFIEEVAIKREFLSDYSVYQLGSYAEMILAAKGFRVLSYDEFCSDVAAENSTPPDTSGNSPDPKDEPPHVCAETLEERFKYEYPDKIKTIIPEKVSVSKLYPRLFDEADDGVTDLEEIGKQKKKKGSYVPAFISGETEDSKARGIATHMFLQFCNLDRLAKHTAEEELADLVRERFLSEGDAKLVRIDEAEAFRNSNLFRQMLGAEKIWRELRFNVKLPCEMFATELDMKESLVGEEVLVQGVIDCLILDKDGEYHLVDYKTDRLTAKELSDRKLAEDKLRSSHERQLGYYAEAVKIMFSKFPETVEVYSMPLGDTLSVKK